MNNLNLNRRNFCTGISALATGSVLNTAFPLQSHAFLGAILRFMFRGIIRRSAQRQAGRILGHTAANMARVGGGVSLTGALGAVSMGMWGVIGAVELRSLWNDGQIQNLLGRNPDFTIKKDQENLPIEISSHEPSSEQKPIGMGILAIPQADLQKQEVKIIDHVIGQGLWEAGEILTLGEYPLPINQLDQSNYIISPYIMNEATGQIEEVDFGFDNNAAIVKLT